jgi:hypothetical protein
LAQQAWIGLSGFRESLRDADVSSIPPTSP